MNKNMYIVTSLIKQINTTKNDSVAIENMEIGSKGVFVVFTNKKKADKFAKKHGGGIITLEANND